MGLEFSHAVCDGLGAAQFLNAVAELAPAHLPLPSIPPVWARNALVVNNNKADAVLEDDHHHPVDGLEDQMQPPSVPPLARLPSPDQMGGEQQLQRATFDVSMEQVAQLKRRLLDLTGRPCSAFEVLTAAIWRSRARAMVDGNDDDDDEMRVVFFVNARRMVEPPLPEGFYGNCFFPVTVTAAAGRIRGASLGEVVGWIQQGKGRAGEEFREWVGGRGGSGAFDPPLTYTTVLVSEWGRLGFGGVDFGWGPPAHIMPIQYSNLIPGCILCTPPPPPKTGIRLMTWCLYPSHLSVFSHQLLHSLSHD